jgi:hypothetical protein
VSEKHSVTLNKKFNQIIEPTFTLLYPFKADKKADQIYSQPANGSSTCPQVSNQQWDQDYR